MLCVSDLRVGRPIRQRYDAMLDIGLSVTGIDYARDQGHGRFQVFVRRTLYWLFRHNLGPFPLLDLSDTNKRILEEFKKRKWDILWLDMALTVERSTLLQVKQCQPECMIIGFSHDDMLRRHHQSGQFLEHLELYDVFYTTKSWNVGKLGEMGCKRCHFIDNSFDPNTHRPLAIPRPNALSNGPQVGFVGTWEKEREELLRKVARSGIAIHVWGGNWSKHSSGCPNMVISDGNVRGDEYAKALCSLEIAICFLAKRLKTREYQTTRSIEIPACGVFMLAERTDEHMALFEEGKEAEYFSTTDELIQKIRYYLNNPEQRKQIAAAGRERCLRDGYSNQERIRKIIEDVCGMRDVRFS